METNALKGQYIVWKVLCRQSAKVQYNVWRRKSAGRGFLVALMFLAFLAKTSGMMTISGEMLLEQSRTQNIWVLDILLSIRGSLPGCLVKLEWSAAVTLSGFIARETQFLSSFKSLSFYHGLCLKGKPWSCGHPVARSLINHLTELTRTDMSAKPATGVEE